MAADEPRTWDNLNVSEEFPRDAMLAFMMMHGRNPQANLARQPPTQLIKNLEQYIFELLLDDSAETRERVGLGSPPTSPRPTLRVPDAPKAPTRPTSLAVAQAPGQPQPTAVRTLFGAVPAVVPDA